jgi:hypothetical protein
VTAADAESVQESLIGVPIPDMQLYVLDASGNHALPDEVGELYVGGGGVTRGYLNRPQLNAERFIPDIFTEKGGRLYRSGDIARVRPDGEIVYLGRNDGQVKISGFRIELGEVEAAVASYPGVQQSCVVANTDANGTQRLAAYFVGPAEVAPTTRAFSDFLATRLPAHMIPSFYTKLDQLPLTLNGKLDLAALKTPIKELAVASNGTPSQMLSRAEEQVAKVWRAVLSIEHIGLDDNFFDIGGTSLLLMGAHLRLQAAFDRQFPITWMFECTTVSALAKRLSETAALPASINAIQQRAQKQRDAFARARAVKSVAQ